MSKRVAFTFDDRSYTSLEEMTEEGQFGSLAETVREALLISRVLQSQAKEGFSEVTLRNPRTGEEKTIIIPSLDFVQKKKS